MARTTIRTEDITDSEVTTAKMATDPTNASNLTSGSVPLAQLGNVDTTGLENDIAILGFKVAANGSLAKYNLVDQTIDAFEDASGIDAGASTNEVRNASNYYSGVAAVTPSVSGNYDDSGVDGDYSWYKWTTVTSSGTYTTDTAQDYEYLVVAGGGGGGGGYYCAAGGAGGMLTATGFAVAATTISGITVGAGGTGGAANPAQGGDGSDSVFSSITSDGGGGGGMYSSGNGRTGGSGGGGAGSGTSGVEGGVGGAATAGQGYAGGVGNYRSGGGGGGASEVGAEGDPSAVNVNGVGGDGGDGIASSISGSSVTYAGGGGGGASNNATSAGTGGSGGAGGGGNGASGQTAVAQDGTVNTGGGGGGASFDTGSYATGGDGGSGIVVIRRPAIDPTYNDMTLISNATTAEATPTKGDLVMTYTNGAGTASIGDGTNGDIRAFVSRDDGTTYTQFTLADEGDTGGHIILTAHDLDISTQPSDTSMLYKITTHNQSASLETRIQAVSLGWS